MTAVTLKELKAGETHNAVHNFSTRAYHRLKTVSRLAYMSLTVFFVSFVYFDSINDVFTNKLERPCPGASTDNCVGLVFTTRHSRVLTPQALKAGRLNSPIIKISSILRFYKGPSSILRTSMRTTVFLVDLTRINGDNY